MSLTKNWINGEKVIERTGENDHLDANEEAWQWQRYEHDRGFCEYDKEHCAFCKADEEAQHYERHVFDRIFSVVNRKEKP